MTRRRPTSYYDVLAAYCDVIRRAAQVDTLPKGQDAKQGLAGTEGSAVGESRCAHNEDVSSVKPKGVGYGKQS